MTDNIYWKNSKENLIKGANTVIKAITEMGSLKIKESKVNNDICMNCGCNLSVSYKDDFCTPKCKFEFTDQNYEKQK